MTLSNQTVVAEPQASLDVSCSICGKPAPVVMWQYEGGNLPAGIDLILEKDVTVDKLTTVTRRLTWTTDSTVQERRSAGGIYMCTGTVYDTHSTSQQIGIDTQCYFFIIFVISFGYKFMLNVIMYVLFTA